jgi:hypothetical protein
MRAPEARRGARLLLRKKFTALGAVACGAAGACSLVAVAAAQAAAPARVGCNTRWPVVAHHADGARVSRPGPLPVPCATETGYATSETTIAATPSGTLFFSPANTENSVARSSDRGATWSLAEPQQMQYTSLWNTVDPDVVVDRRTGRVFWVRATGDLRTTPILVASSPLGWQTATAVAYAHGFQVYSTSDSGQTWLTADYQHEFTGDWQKIYVGPPATGARQPSGYPDVVYVCANAPLEVSGPGRDCYHSLDGGRTFALAGYIFPSASSPHDVCPPLAGGAGGGVGSDGSFYQPQSCEGGSWVAVSHDEGASWSWLPITGAPGANGITAGLQLAIDQANNLYALWTDGAQLELSISHDRGKTWGHPLGIAAPKLKQIDLPALAAGAAGHIGVAYYGSADGSAKTLTAYVTETGDALARRPLFYSAALNDPAHPIFHDYAGSETPRADFVGATYDRSGNLWAGVVKQLGPPNASNTVPTTGYVGTLTPAARAHHRRRPLRHRRTSPHRRRHVRVSRARPL